MIMEKLIFTNKEEFKNYVISDNPKEIWLDEFSEDVPYIIATKYRDGCLSGAYYNQCLLVHSLQEIDKLYEEGMYVKI